MDKYLEDFVSIQDILQHLDCRILNGTYPLSTYTLGFEYLSVVEKFKLRTNEKIAGIISIKNTNLLYDKELDVIGVCIPNIGSQNIAPKLVSRSRPALLCWHNEYWAPVQYHDYKKFKLFEELFLTILNYDQSKFSLSLISKVTII